MRRLRKFWLRATLWQRLQALVGGTVLLMWLALATASVIFARFQADFSDLAAAQIPRMALVGELASQSARLTTIATGIIGAGGEDAESMSQLKEVAAGLSSSLSDLLAGQDQQAIARVGDLHDQLAELGDLISARQEQGVNNAERLEALRWLNADIQNETDPLLSDYDFNIRGMMLKLEHEREAPARLTLLQQMSHERSLREAALQIGTEAGTVATLLAQASVARDEAQITQLEDLGFDMLARLSQRMADLPQRDEFLTMRQSIALLRGYFDPAQGLIQQRRATLSLEARSYQHVRAVQQGLAALQSDLSTLADDEMRIVQAQMARGALQARWGLAVLAVLTSGLALAGVMLVFGVMRKRIAQPLGEVTARLLQISESADTPLCREQGRDDITRLRNAVDDFARAIQARDGAIADLKRTQADLVQAGKMAALGNLSAGISHELNQPLTAMRYRLELLASAAAKDDPTEARRQIDRVTALADRMQATISHLQRFARQADGRHEPLALQPVVDNAIALVQNRLTETGVSLQIGSGVAGAWVVGIEVLIEQVLVNLLTNALDALAGVARPVIQINAAYADGMIELSVSDNGTGLGDLAPDEVMNPFVTSKEVGRGMGLGLSISYNIAKDMGGDLVLTPRPGGGVIALFHLQPNR